MWRRDCLNKLARHVGQLKHQALTEATEHAAITSNIGGIAEASRPKSTSIRPEQPGVQATMLRLLEPYEQPATVAELWDKAQVKGVKSKRHMKLQLQDLRKRRLLLAKPAGGKHWGYLLNKAKYKQERADETFWQMDQAQLGQQEVAVSEAESRAEVLEEPRGFARFAQRWRS